MEYIYSVYCMMFYKIQYRIRLPRGFCDPEYQHQMCIVFRALVHKEAWGWEDKSSQVYMRFEGDPYGNFQYDYGPGKIERYSISVVLYRM